MEEGVGEREGSIVNLFRKCMSFNQIEFSKSVLHRLREHNFSKPHFSYL